MRNGDLVTRPRARVAVAISPAMPASPVHGLFRGRRATVLGARELLRLLRGASPRLGARVPPLQRSSTGVMYASQSRRTSSSGGFVSRTTRGSRVFFENSWNALAWRAPLSKLLLETLGATSSATRCRVAWSLVARGAAVTFRLVAPVLGRLAGRLKTGHRRPRSCQLLGQSDRPLACLLVHVRSDPLGAGDRLRLKNISTNEI